MSDLVKAKKENGDKQVFSRQVWDNLPGDKYGWTEETAAEAPDEIKTLLKGSVPSEDSQQKQTAKGGQKNKV